MMKKEEIAKLSELDPELAAVGTILHYIFHCHFIMLTSAVPPEEPAPQGRLVRHFRLPRHARADGER